MNSNWNKIFQVIQKPERLIIGLMSGTSLDGLDVALCAISGDGAGTKLNLLEFKTIAYDNEFRAQIKSVFSRRDADLELICLMNEKIGIVHAEMILQALKSWKRLPGEIDVIASHGQTIYHAPRSLHERQHYPNGTLQIGDGDHIAVNTGIITISDFRQKHVAAGGEGAPLAVYGDYLLFSEKTEDRIMLNIGGIANFTYLPKDNNASKVFSTDVGPGNTLMDQFVQSNYKGMHYDQDGAIANSGKVNEKLLAVLLSSDFLKENFPKTTGPELFNLKYLENSMKISDTLNLSNEDVMATLCSFTSNVIVNAIKRCFDANVALYIYMSGGGMYNKLLVKELKAGLPNANFYTTDALGINPDAKEAVLFAVLANETLAGNLIDFGKRAGVPTVRMGKVCFPD